MGDKDDIREMKVMINSQTNERIKLLKKQVRIETMGIISNTKKTINQLDKKRNSARPSQR